MHTKLRIAVAEDEPRMREFYREVLPHLGHEVVCVAETGRQLVEQCRTLRPNLIISDIRMPDMDGIEACAQISAAEPIPFILVSAHDDPEYLARAVENHVLAYLIKPIRRQDLQPAIHIAVRRFEEFQHTRQEASDLRQALQDRKLIERAKGIIMKRASLDEPAAFQRLQKLARESNRKLVQVAEMILTVEDAYDGGTLGNYLK